MEIFLASVEPESGESGGLPSLRILSAMLSRFLAP
jgi:hypothetical protein